jgi:hypothetical protein
MTWIVDWLERAFRSLRWLTPREDRALRSEDAAETFRDRCLDSNARGRTLALLGQGLAECWDVVRCVVRRRTVRPRVSGPALRGGRCA